ncbi:MAG: PAS domain-containing protein [Desulfobacterales bacterium]|jgi:PAS domain S-box-containing protein
MNRKNDPQNRLVQDMAAVHEAFWGSAHDQDDLRALRANLSALLDNTDACILFSDHYGKPVFFNRNYARVMREALGIRMAPGIQPHLRLPEAERRWWSELHRRVLGGETFSEEYAHTFPNGTARTFEIRFHPVRISGRIAGFTEVTRDITARKIKESRIRVQRDLAIALGSTRTLSRGLRLCLDAAIQVAEMDSGGIYLLDAASGVFELTAHRGLKKPFVHAASRYLPDSASARIMMEARSRIFQRVDADMPMAEHLVREGIVSFCSVPFCSEERVLGCIKVGSHQRSDIADEDLTALEAIGAQIGGVVARLEAEAALRRQHDLFQSFLDHTPAMIHIRDQEGRYLLSNRRLEELLNLSATELLGKTVDEIFPSDVARRARRQDRRALEAGRPVSFEERLGAKGREREFSDVKFPILLPENGELGVCTISMEITEQKRTERALRESEEHLRSLMETASRFAVYRLRIDPSAPQGLQVVFVSPSIRDLMGVEDPMALENWFANLVPEDRARIVAANRAAFDADRFDEVMRVKLPETKEIRWIHAVSRAVREADGPTRYVNGIVIDISEQKRIEQALQDRERQLKSESKKLQEANVALRVLLKKREEDRSGLEEKVLTNVNELVYPYLRKALDLVSDPKVRIHLDIVQENLNQIISPFARKLTSPFFRLTPAEIQVAHLVRHGYSSKEIAEQLGISPKTVEVHRLNIRKKLGIAGKRTNLRTYLLSLG